MVENAITLTLLVPVLLALRFARNLAEKDVSGFAFLKCL